MPRVRLPENFVARPDALAAVKGKLLLESEQTLVVSAITGLGGLGKSVLATAIVLDEEVRSDSGVGLACQRNSRCITPTLYFCIQFYKQTFGFCV